MPDHTSEQSFENCNSDILSSKLRLFLDTLNELKEDRASFLERESERNQEAFMQLDASRLQDLHLQARALDDVRAQLEVARTCTRPDKHLLIDGLERRRQEEFCKFEELKRTAYKPMYTRDSFRLAQDEFDASTREKLTSLVRLGQELLDEIRQQPVCKFEDVTAVESSLEEIGNQISQNPTSATIMKNLYSILKRFSIMSQTPNLDGDDEGLTRNPRRIVTAKQLEEIACRSPNRLPVQIRWLIRRDMSKVLAIEKQSFRHTWSEDDFLSSLRQRNIIGMVAEHNYHIVGFMVYELHKELIRILNFAVAPESRRKKIGTQMALRLVDKLSQQRRKELRTEVRESNVDAQKFFSSCGFVANQTLHRLYDDTKEDAYLFSYQLAPDDDRFGV